MANADCIVLMGGNMAEAHPVGFQWVAEAKARGARVIHVDPRFTRTSAVVDKHIPMGGFGHRAARWVDQLRADPRQALPRLRRRVHQRGSSDRRRFRRPRRPRRTVLGFDPRPERDTASWQYSGGQTRRSPIRSRCSSSQSGTSPAHAGHGRADVRRLGGRFRLLGAVADRHIPAPSAPVVSGTRPAGPSTRWVLR